MYRESGERPGSDILITLATLHQRQGEYVEAKRLFEEALAASREIGDRRGEADSYSGLAIVYKIQSDYVKAQEYLKKALIIRSEIGDRKGEAAEYGNLGTVFRALGKYVKAKECQEKALRINKEIGDRQGIATDYGNLGTVFECLGEYVKAKECLEKALVIGREIGDRDGQAANYTRLGTVFNSLGESVKAKESHGKALVIAKEAGDKYIEAACYGGLGIAFQSLGEYKKAVEYNEKALMIRKEIGHREGEASSYGNLGTIFQYLGEYGKAKEHYEKALPIRREIGDREGEAADYGNLGTVLHFLNESVKAIEYINKELVIRKEIGDRKGEGASYGRLGSVFRSLGEYTKANKYHEKELAIAKEIGNRRGEASSYGSLGNVFHSLGENVKAVEYNKKALAIRKEIGDRQGEAWCYEHLGVAFYYLGEYDKANEFNKKALEIAQAIGNRGGEASSYGNLGSCFRVIGEYTKAKEYHEKALAIRKQIGDRQGEAVVYGNLGTVFQSLGECVKAEEYLKKAVLISEEIEDVVKQVPFLSKLAWLKFSEGKIQEAYSYLLPSIQKCEDLRGFLGNNDQFKISFSDKNNFPYWTLSSMLCSSGNPYEALYVAELGRARALADLMAAHYSVEIQISANPRSWVGIERIMKKESNCTCLYISYDARKLFSWVIKESGFVHFRETKVNESVQKRVLTNDNAVFDESFNIFRILSEEHCEDRSLNGMQPTPESFREDRPNDFQMLKEDKDNQKAEQNLSQYYKMIIAPVADVLKEAEIIIVPDRSLYKVPYAALRDESGKYLSETFRIRIVPSLTTLKLIQDSPADYHSQTGALIVGDPDVGQVNYKGCITNMPRLPCAEKEASMVGGKLGVQPLLGEHATKQAVLQAINSVSLIHFAAHGNAERGEIALAPLRTTDGIPQEEDYLLTMSDISRVQLRAKLVVLSCCHSARGQIRAEGVVGIARAFLGSGARSVLVALWAIDDSATEQLMSRFYEHLVRGVSASESLNEAMKWMRANGYSDVSQWAPFMLIGDNVTFDFG